MLEFDKTANKKTTPLRSWLHNQANKFLYKFHSEKRQKLTLALESECWKQTDITNEIQNFVNQLLSIEGFFNSSNINQNIELKSLLNNCEFLIINNERYATFGYFIFILKIV